jgi:hypothetical protein
MNTLQSCQPVIRFHRQNHGFCLARFDGRSLVLGFDDEVGDFANLVSTIPTLVSPASRTSSTGNKSHCAATSRFQMPKSRNTRSSPRCRDSLINSDFHLLRNRMASLICPEKLAKDFLLTSQPKPDVSSSSPRGLVRGYVGSPRYQTQSGWSLERLRKASGSNFVPNAFSIQDITFLTLQTTPSQTPSPRTAAGPPPVRRCR